MYSTDTCSRWIQTSWWSIHSTRTSGTRFPTLTTAVPTQISPQTIGSWSSGELVLLHWLLQINIKLSLRYNHSEVFYVFTQHFCDYFFREIFYVTEEMLAVPKLYVPINTCLLRVVNNDNGEEIPRVFQKVAPYVYKKNRVSQPVGFEIIIDVLTDMG